MLTLSFIADVLGILGFILGLFALNKVINISKNKESNKTKVSGETKIGGDFVGRDKK